MATQTTTLPAQRELSKEIAGPRLNERSAFYLTAAAARCYGDKDYRGAELAAKTALASDPYSHPAWMVLGGALAKQKYFRLAAECFEHALRLRPNDVEAWVALGESFVSMLDYKAASVALKRALELDPEAAHPAGRRARAIVGRTIKKLSQS
jgi:cytochrome c-type biogenesis protein CcmH/NrfG